MHWRGQRAVVVLYGERDPDSEFAGGTQTPSHAGCVAVLPRVENVNVRFINVASEAGKKLLGESEPLLQKRP